MTGRRSLEESAAVQTFKYRQSSLVGGGAFAFGPPAPPCVQRGAYSVAVLTPDHFATGCGARQRFAPTGGAANGIPLKVRMSELAPAVPAIVPLSIMTSAGIAAKAPVVAVMETAVSSRRRIAIPPNVDPSPYGVAATRGRTYNRARLDFMQPFYANVLRLSKRRGASNPR